MSLNILGGVAKGFSLVTPKSFKTRPTSILLKRRLFDSIQDFSGCTFIDLCAGSGSIGLEALSRNAHTTYLVELNSQALSCIKTNTKKLNEKYLELGECFVHKDDCIKWLNKNQGILSSNDNLLFFDPPYEMIELYKKFFVTIRGLNYQGKIIVEACTQKTMGLNEFGDLFGEPDKIFKQGTSFFAIYDFK